MASVDSICRHANLSGEASRLIWSQEYFRSVEPGLAKYCHAWSVQYPFHVSDFDTDQIFVIVG